VGEGESDSKHPLAGLRVLDMARVLAGPWIGQTLADLGADVIKVESAGGDDTRGWGPPWVEGEEDERLDAAYFPASNRGKRSMITGFGQDGPYAPRAGYDYIIQGMSGIMDLTGEPEGDPQRIGVAFADIFTGLYGVIAIEAALLHREKTGKGQHIDMALLDTMTAVLANQAQSYLSTGRAPKRTGNYHPAIAPYQSFQCADYPVIVTVGNDGQFRRFVTALGVPEMADDPRYLTNAARVGNRDALTAALAALCGAIKRDTLLATLEEAGVPAGPINSVAQAFEDPQIRHREMVVDLPHTGVRGGTKGYVRSPIRFSEAELALKRGAPRLGEHTDEILREIGWEN